MRRITILGLAAALLTVATSAEAQAWGAFHAGFTRVGFGGVEHYGRNVAVGPYGAYSGVHYGTAGYGGYGGGFAAGGVRYATPYGGAAVGGYHYSTPYGGYAAGGYHYSPTYGGSAWNYSNGVYRVY
jgi:hypothetical protein